MSLDQALLAEALRPKPTTALPAAVAMVQAQAVIKRAHDSAPMFTDVEPALDAPMAFGRDSLPPPPPVPAGPVAESDAGIPASLETRTAEPVVTSAEAAPAPKRTGLHGREILTLKKSRKVKS
jgi:hypothetical protein